MVVTIVAIMTLMVTEVVRTAAVRIQLAAHQRDEAMAEALAEGGVQLYRLVLIGSNQIGEAVSSYAAMLNINALELWQAIPTFSSNLMRILLVTDGDEDDAAEVSAAGGLTRDQIEETQEFETSLYKNFLAFEGDFTVTVEDEDRRIFVGNMQGATLPELMNDPNASLLSGLLTGEGPEQFLRDLDMEKWELISNLADWTDLDDVRIYQGGAEDQLYSRLDDPYLPKNAPFDSVQEIRLVDGWHLDEVWNRFGQHLTVKGDGKINVNTAERRVLEALIQRFVLPPPNDDYVDTLIQKINEFRNTPPLLGGGVFRDGNQFKAILEANLLNGFEVDPAISEAVDVKSKIFRVTSVGEVGKAQVAIEVIIDFERSNLGQITSWRVL